MAPIDNDMRAEAAYVAAMEEPAPAAVPIAEEWPDLPPYSAAAWKRLKPWERRVEQWRRNSGLPNRCPGEARRVLPADDVAETFGGPDVEIVDAA